MSAIAYASHQPILGMAIAMTEGPVLELGVGAGSTPFLHHVCARRGRHVLSLESDRAWADRYALSFALADRHVFELVTAWERFDLPSERWGVVFVDHGCIGERSRHVRQALDVADLVVVHDTEDPRYAFDPVLAQARHRFDYCPPQLPWTTVVSSRRKFL